MILSKYREVKRLSFMNNDELILRNLLWLNHGHFDCLYGDDGEMQCNKCRIDFKRDSVKDIKKRFDDIKQQKAISYFKKQNE